MIEKEKISTSFESYLFTPNIQGQGEQTGPIK